MDHKQVDYYYVDFELNMAGQKKKGRTSEVVVVEVEHPNFRQLTQFCWERSLETPSMSVGRSVSRSAVCKFVDDYTSATRQPMRLTSEVIFVERDPHNVGQLTQFGWERSLETPIMSVGRSVGRSVSRPVGSE